MKWRNEYLSEEELKMLISEVEQNDMVAAPPDITESILTIVVEDKRKEFWNYCFWVWTFVAAAIVMVFLLPKLRSFKQMQESRQEPKWSDATSRQESVLAEWKESNSDMDVDNRIIFNELFSGSNIFGNEDRFNLFSERNGG